MADPEKKPEEPKFRVLAASKMKDGHRRLGVLLPDGAPIEVQATRKQLEEAKADPDVILLELEGDGAAELAERLFPAHFRSEALKRAEERAAKAEARVTELEAQLAKVQQGKGGKQ